MDLRVKRVYEPAERADGSRILVDRLWPRGLSKERAHLDLWLKDIAPSTELRKWFGHDPAKRDEFERRYVRELDENPEAVQRLQQIAKQGRVTLLYGARDTQDNQAVVLREYLLGKVPAGKH